VKWGSAAIARCRNCDAHVSVGSWPYENSSARRSVKFRLFCNISGSSPAADVAAADIPQQALSARNSCTQQQPDRRCAYSITSSAVASSIDGISRPSSLAVFKLMTSSNLVGC